MLWIAPSPAIPPGAASAGAHGRAKSQPGTRQGRSATCFLPPPRSRPILSFLTYPWDRGGSAFQPPRHSFVPVYKASAELPFKICQHSPLISPPSIMRHSSSPKGSVCGCSCRLHRAGKTKTRGQLRVGAASGARAVVWAQPAGRDTGPILRHCGRPLNAAFCPSPLRTQTRKLHLLSFTQEEKSAFAVKRAGLAHGGLSAPQRVTAAPAAATRPPAAVLHQAPARTFCPLCPQRCGGGPGPFWREAPGP